MSSALGCGLLTDHRSELNAQAEAYLEELRAATAAAHERLRAGIMRLHPQTHFDDPMPDPLYAEQPRMSEDPVFATREFDIPPSPTGALVDFDMSFDR